MGNYSDYRMICAYPTNEWYDFWNNHGGREKYLDKMQEKITEEDFFKYYEDYRRAVKDA